MRNPGKEFREENLPRLLKAARSIKTPKYLCFSLISIAKIYAHFGRKQELLSLLREIIGVSYFVAVSEEKARMLSDIGILYSKMGNVILADKYLSDGIEIVKSLPGRFDNQAMFRISSSCMEEIINNGSSGKLLDFFLYYSLKTTELITADHEKILAQLKLIEIYSSLNERNNIIQLMDRTENAILRSKMRMFIIKLLPLLMRAEQQGWAQRLFNREMDNINSISDSAVRNQDFLILAEGCVEAGMKDEALRILHENIVTSDYTSQRPVDYFPFGSMTEIYLKLGMKEEAFSALNKLLSSIESSKSEFLSDNMSIVAWATERYLKLGDNGKAEKLLNLVKFLPLEYKWGLKSIRLYISVGNLFINFQKRYDAAVYMKKAIKRTEKREEEEEKSYIISELADLYTSIVDSYEEGNNAKIKNEK